MRGNSLFSSRTEVLCRSAVLSLPPAALHILPPLSSLCWVSTNTGLVLMWLFCFWSGRCEHPIFVLDVHHLSALLTPPILYPSQWHFAVSHYFSFPQWLRSFREQGKQSQSTPFQVVLQRAGMCLLLSIFWEHGCIFIVWSKCQPEIFDLEF